MAQSNHERIGKALEILNTGLRPFVEREMLSKYGTRWRYEAVNSLRDHHIIGDDELNLDTQALLLILWDQWRDVFNKVLGHAERSIVSELRTTRDSWAHQNSFSTDDTYRALDNIYRLLISISAEEASEIDRQRHELLRIRFDEQARREARKVATTSLESLATHGLPPWRNIITPHPDVASGMYQQAEFAADLNQVYQNLGSSEYRIPRDFFQRTFLTEGLKQLLTGALRRLSGTGGDPVIELQTNFGGGKTHSLLALYHLFSGVTASDLIGMEPALQAAGVEQPPIANCAVLVGYALSPGQGHEKPDGTRIYTLWGELAWQLLGRDGYDLLAEADRNGVSPGADVLRTLFTTAAPCLILIDEWVTYVRQLYEQSSLPAGSFDANLSFAQALTEAVKATSRTLLVATLPASDAEAGGEGGREALARLRHVFGRVESPWRPANSEEGFEIVRRRLFEPMSDAASFRARDTVARTFVEFYRSQAQEFPSDCREYDYERRMRAAYPIHPELFDRLYNDWSSIEAFQRTRGVLRLMAAVVHALWVEQDMRPLILPGSIPIDDSRVRFELTRYLEPVWEPIIEHDIDGPRSLPRRLDRELPNLGRYLACLRVARTIYLGSAPTQNSANRGLEDNQIKLGSVQPGESVATFGDALRRLTDQATHLYQNEKRYWYSTQRSVARLAQERAAQFDDDTVFDEIEKRLKPEQQRRGDFARVHVCPSSGADIIDDDFSARLAILKPHFTHALRDQSSSARQEATRLLDWRGNARRNYRNTLVFLAADRSRLEDLKQAIRQYLAWSSIQSDTEELNLDAHSRTQVRTKRDEAQKTIEMRIPETYIWLIVPTQPNPKQSESTLEEFRLQPQPADSLSANASRKLRIEEFLITKLNGTRLRLELDRIPLWGREYNHVSVKDLAEYFARYIYLPRLKSTEVLLDAIREGLQNLLWQRETFAYADRWDTTRERYINLSMGQLINIHLNSEIVLVHPDAAQVQKKADEEEEASRKAEEERKRLPREGSGKTGGTTITDPPPFPPVPGSVNPPIPIPTSPPAGGKAEKRLRRFHGSVRLNERRMALDAGTIMEEVVKHVTSLYGARVKVTLEIQAEIPDGLSDNTVRTVKENCRTLKFEIAEFEEE